MAIKLVTDWRTFFALAGALGQARLRGDSDEIRQAQEAHDSLIRKEWRTEK